MCIKESKKIWVEKTWVIYIMFVFWFGFNSCASGYSSNFLRQLIGFYLVAYIGSWSTHILIKKYNVKILIYTIIVLGIIDAVVTILQYYNNPVATAIGLFLVPHDAENLLSSIDRGVNISIPGMFGFVNNGYFLLIAYVFSLYLIIKNKNWFKFLPLILLFLACFLSQQRSPFYISLLITVLFIFKYFKHLKGIKKNSLVLVTILVLVYIVPKIINFSVTNNLRYTSFGMEGTGREKIYQEAYNYILNNKLDANIYDYINKTGTLPHFLFFNMFIYGGLLGFIPIMIVFIIHFSTSIKIVLMKSIKHTVVNLIFALALLAFTGNSLTHNDSIVNASFLYWIIWTALSTCGNNK